MTQKQKQNFITEKIYQITHETGMSNLSISKCINKAIVRFDEVYYELKCDDYIDHIRSHYDNANIVDVYICTMQSFYHAIFNIPSRKFSVAYKENNLYINQISTVFHPEILIKTINQVTNLKISPFYVYSTQNNKLQTPSTSQSKNLQIFNAVTTANKLYAIQNNNNIYIFDVESNNNLTKITLQQKCLCHLEYLNNIQSYFLFIVYENLEVEVQTLVYLQQNQLRAIVKKNCQTIKLQQKINSNFRLRNLSVKLIVSQSKQIFYSFTIQCKIEDKSSLFIKNQLILDSQQKFTVNESTQLLYINSNISRIQTCHFKNKVCYFVDSRAYITHDLKVCDNIFIMDEHYTIISVLFQNLGRDQNFLILIGQHKETKHLQIEIYNIDNQEKTQTINVATTFDQHQQINVKDSSAFTRKEKIYIIIGLQILVVDRQTQQCQKSFINSKYQSKINTFFVLDNFVMIANCVDHNLNIFQFTNDDLLEDNPAQSIYLHYVPSKIEYHQIPCYLQLDISKNSDMSRPESSFSIANMQFVQQTNEAPKYISYVMFPSQLKENDPIQFKINNHHNKLFMIHHNEVQKVTKSTFGLWYQPLIKTDNKAEEFATSIATYNTDVSNVKQFISIQNGYISNDEIDENLNFEQMSQMFQNAEKVQNKALNIFAQFLAMNQLKVVDSITKFNKNELSPWLAAFYKTLDPVNSPLPKISLDQIYNSQFLILAPVYHLQDIMFSAANATYAQVKDPFKVAFWYVLCGKVPILGQLFKMSKQDKIYEFLKRDFSQEVHQQAASKNAFTLLSKHNFDLAATWFLIGQKYFDALKIVMSHNYMNQKYLAMRCANLLQIQNKITSEQYEKLLNNIIEECEPTIEQHGQLGLIIENFTLKLQAMLILKKDIDQYQFYKFYENIVDIKEASLISLQEKDVSALSAFVILSHYFFQNKLISELNLLFVKRMLIVIKDDSLSVSYQRLSSDLGYSSLLLFSYQMNKQNEQKQRLSTDQDIHIDTILDHYQQFLTSHKELTIISKNDKLDMLIQLLYSLTTHFKNQFDSAGYVQLGLQKKFNGIIYQKYQQLNLNLKELIIMYIALCQMQELCTADQNQFGIFSKIIINYQKIYGHEFPDKSAGTFDQAFQVINSNALTDYERQFLQLLMDDTEKTTQEQICILIEQGILKGTDQFKRFKQHEGIVSCIDKYRILQRNITINIKQINSFTYQQDKNYIMYIINVYPVLIALFDGSRLFIIQYNNQTKEANMIAGFETHQFNIDPYGIMLMAKDKIIKFQYQLNRLEQKENDPMVANYQDINNLLFQQLQSEYNKIIITPIYQFDKLFECQMAIQQSRHKMIAMSVEQFDIYYLELNYLKQCSKPLNEIAKLQGVKKIIQIQIIKENQIFAIIKNQLNQTEAISLYFNDLLYEQKVQLNMQQQLDFEVLQMLQYSNNTQSFVILLNHKEFYTYQVFQGEIKLICHNQFVTDKKAILSKVFDAPGNFCCCKSGLRIVCGDQQVLEFCPYCAKEYENKQNQQICEMDNIKIVLK